MRKKFKISKAVIEKDGKYLLLKRATTSFLNTWDFAGGRDDPGETPSQSVVREVKEETSFDIEPGNKVKKSFYSDSDYELTFWYFKPKSFTGNLTLSNDHSEHIWVKEKEIKDLPLHPSVVEFFK